jgi:hypothetical protein
MIELEYPPLPPPFVWREHNGLPAIYEGNLVEGNWWFTWVQIKTKGYPQRIMAETRRGIRREEFPVSEDATPEELAQAMFTIFTFMEK